MTRRPVPPLDLQTRGRQFMWFDHEERYLPVVDEGQPMPPKEHYAAAERLIRRLHERRHGR